MIEALDATISARQSELLGILYLDSRAPSSAFSALDREVVRTLAREAATVVENARLFAASRAKARLDHEIEIASQIQQKLLPKALPNLPNVAVAGSTIACYSVGGDCFDVIELDGGRHGFFVGDISGKGIPAALLATLLQGVFLYHRDDGYRAAGNFFARKSIPLRAQRRRPLCDGFLWRAG